MRTARLVGPTADGTSILFVTEDGEELTVVVDDSVRATLQQAQDGPGPDAAQPPATAVRRQPRRREAPMDTPLTPRDIQTRIRSGESLEDVAAGSGMDADRIERFAAPVLAEREHLALTALGSSIRRRGESSGHRPLRAVVAERLLAQGLDPDDVRWDAWKRDDNAWQVTADYELEGEPRHAEFRFDPQGRFSHAEDDEARWLAGEQPSPAAASNDRDDELALVRATREPSRDTEAGDTGPETETETETDGDAETDDGDPYNPDLAEVIAQELGAVLQVVPPVELSEEELGELVANDPESDDGPAPAPRDEAAEPTIAVVRHLTRVTVEVDRVDAEETLASGSAPSDEAGADEARSALDTLYDMLGGYAEESPRVYAGLSDATAVPQVDAHDFEPPANVLVPAEPDAEAPEQDPDEQQPDEQEPDEQEPGDEESAGGPAAREVPVPADEDPEPLIPSPGASRKPGRRKRASVPSWDEIMFGGPKPG